ncbi:MAG: WD40/YVTN/BNR-like repeat-containing protein [Vicinamibacterales bacterium]
MRAYARSAALWLLVLLVAAPAGAQLDEHTLSRLPWRAIGPAVMGGRIDDVAVDERNPSVIYVGAASGGLWKSTNAGTTWVSLFDGQRVSSIGDVALAPSNPEIVWVGTGEPNNRQSSSFGDGVYKSADGGHNWTHTGLRDTQHIGRVIVDPSDPDIVYVAALGRLWGPHQERGVFKTTDGGRTWTSSLFIDEDTGVVDLVMDPQDRQVLYAAAYQRRRVAWGFNGGGPGGGIHKTTDGGRTWTKLTNGLPQGVVGRIGLAIWRNNPQVLYALVEHREAGGTFRSDDGGATWRRVNALNPRPMYYSKIHIDPTDDQRIYVLGASMYVSADGGTTFADPATGRPGANQSMSPTYDVGVHGDHHALWINPANPKHLILGNDGGLYYSFDGSVTWDKVNNIPLGQFYAIGVDMQKPYTIYGGLQDTHSWGGPSATRHQIGITNADWFQINFGDGMYAQVDPSDPDIIYTESQGGNLVRFHRATGDRKSIKPHPAAGEPPYRFNWTSPVVISPHDLTRIYLGGNRVFTSRDRGDTWTASNDLTRAENRDSLPIMGVLPSAEMLSRHDGVGAWGTITTLAESSVTAGLLWAGTDDGSVAVSRDAGRSWTLLQDRIPPLTGRGRISRVEPSHTDAGTAYVAVDRHEYDDFSPHLYVTRDFGQTWTSLGAGLPPIGWINVVREHPQNPSVLFVGTETGLFVSIDGGRRWTRFTGTFPTVPVDDLVIHPRDNDLIVGTHGRSIYVLDEISWLSALPPEMMTADIQLFPPRPATVVLRWKNESYGAQRQFIGPNPPEGAIVHYWLGSPSQESKMIVRDAQGALVRELTATGDRGLNRVVWDLRANGPEGLPNGRGPLVVPGTYRVYLSAAGGSVSAPVHVEWDPELPMTDEERSSRFRFLTGAGRLQGRVHAAAVALSAVRTQVASTQDQLTRARVSAQVAETIARFASTVEQLQRRMVGGGAGAGGGGVRSRVNGLIGEIDGSGVQQGTLSGPTTAQTARLAVAQGEVDELMDDVDRALGSELRQLNDQITRLKLPRITVSWPSTRTTASPQP